MRERIGSVFVNKSTSFWQGILAVGIGTRCRKPKFLCTNLDNFVFVYLAFHKVSFDLSNELKKFKLLFQDKISPSEKKVRASRERKNENLSHFSPKTCGGRKVFLKPSSSNVEELETSTSLWQMPRAQVHAKSGYKEGRKDLVRREWSFCNTT